MAERTVYYGTFIHSKSLSELEYLEKAVGVDENGKIALIVNSGEQVPDDWKDAKEVRARTNQFFFPGFIGSPSSLKKNTFSNLYQTPISMPASTQIQVYLERRRSSTG